MAEVIFNYKGINTKVQCDINNTMKEIIEKFLKKLKNKEKNLFYLYNGTRIKYELTFNQQANDLDKNRKQMNILVTKNEEINNKIYEIISKDIICPECKENILL